MVFMVKSVKTTEAGTDTRARHAQATTSDNCICRATHKTRGFEQVIGQSNARFARYFVE
jgi:hypothetical protein